MRLNTHVYNALWSSNGKKCTIMTFIYTAVAVGCMMYGDTVVGMLCLVMAELSKVDKELRFLAVEQAEDIIKANDEADKNDE